MKRKKWLVSIAATVILASGLTYNPKNVEAKSNFDEITVNSTWTWYYTDYTLADGWYEKWYINHSTGKKKKETYNSLGKLVGVKFY